MAKNVLKLDHITMQFGGVVAVNDLSMEVNEHEIVALIRLPASSSHVCCVENCLP